MMTTRKKPAANQTKSTSFVEKVTESAHEAIDQIAEHVEPKEEQIREVALQARDQAYDSAQQARDASKDLTDEISRKVRENPIAAIGIAAVIGYFLSSLLRR